MFSKYLESSRATDKKVSIGVSVKPTVKAKLEKIANEKDTNVSTLVSTMIDYCLNETESVGAGNPAPIKR